MSNSDTLTWLSKDSHFYEINEKIAKNINLNEKESTYALSVAILLIKEFERDRRRISFLEFGYFLILSYSLQSNNYTPLFDLSTNLGFYPISKFIIDNGLIENSFSNELVANGLKKFKYNDITETLEQNKYRNQLIESSANDNCYIAPTSFGKSAMIVELIKNITSGKIFIIVPTKSLLTQTYKLISSFFTNRKVIFHDEMYDGEDSFIAVFTQERALRLLKSQNNMQVDVLLIDEAHNLFESSSRSILLSRLIRRVRMRKPDSHLYYFSPLINDSNNLKFEEQQRIETRKIQFNIKEPDISEFRLDGSVYKYNRFLNEFFEQQEKTTVFSYIFSNAKNKNFIYLRAPKKVEEFAGLLANTLTLSITKELEELAQVISQNVHEDFYCVELVKRGMLYIHGKLPDLIKEYLEFKFRTINELNFIVANSVILEGVNLPIDNLYILNTHSLGAKELTNLIGRVNRLNEVFSGDAPNLSKLKPSIHFINTEEFNKKNSNMSNKIKELKAGRINDDEVKNPTLLNFDITKFEHVIDTSTNLDSIDTARKAKEKALSIIEREKFLTELPSSELERLKILFFESGLHLTYIDPDDAFDEITNNVKSIKAHPNFVDMDTIEKLYHIFISGFENKILDQSFSRLKNEKAQNYYRSFVKNIHMLTLKEHINSTVRYFYKNATDTGNNLFYIGRSYGEVNNDGNTSGTRTYIDLSTKNKKELVNLALVKIKMESDFLSYKLNEYVAILKEFGIVSEDEHNMFIYGTVRKASTNLTRLGLSGAIIRKFELDGQINNIEIDSFGHVFVNDYFMKYLNKQDDLVQFEIKKYLAL